MTKRWLCHFLLVRATFSICSAATWPCKSPNNSPIEDHNLPSWSSSCACQCLAQLLITHLACFHEGVRCQRKDLWACTSGLQANTTVQRSSQNTDCSRGKPQEIPQRTKTYSAKKENLSSLKEREKTATGRRVRRSTRSRLQASTTSYKSHESLEKRLSPYITASRSWRALHALLAVATRE